jgi:hypothetical protein
MLAQFNNGGVKIVRLFQNKKAGATATFWK